MSTIRFLTRTGCHLCDESRSVLDRAVRRTGHRVLEVDIDTDDALLGEYGMRIPVVLAPDGRVVAEGIIDDMKTLRRALREMEGTI